MSYSIIDGLVLVLSAIPDIFILYWVLINCSLLSSFHQSNIAVITCCTQCSTESSSQSPTTYKTKRT